MGQRLKCKVTLPDPAATEQFAQQLAAALPENAAGWVVLLQGELGAGKSSIARAMLHALGHTGTVPSPTYTLVEPYRLSHYSVYHVDLYRIATGDELDQFPDLFRVHSGRVTSGDARQQAPRFGGGGAQTDQRPVPGNRAPADRWPVLRSTACRGGCSSR